ncbi:ribonuclease P protein component [Desulfurobacterium atlanticum]|uniref:Ribonuclease P protein component n=1 Tax=Desulfurobacterium atlanticum TaxID=240169 RepID=A0A238ZH71_9BACT|nr:ribonuclease P protein component [Desulfurobacterium atlanticum]SNR82381.1 ribonuclease P protein component [Desulfurobacterium atlanticum]
MEEKISFSLSKEERIKKSAEYKRVFEYGKSLGGSTVALYFLLKEEGFSRAGFIASKRFSKKAVDRNRAKRLMKEVFRLNKHKLRPCDIVLIARKGIKNASYKDVERDFLKLAERAGLIIR